MEADKKVIFLNICNKNQHLNTRMVPIENNSFKSNVLMKNSLNKSISAWPLKSD